ncbi:MAG: tRNA (cytidine(56)-2'-O)-methyltransferase [Candidatus Bathyarchaeia archaeon]|jgi:tRNA (cytidine56-2'-O)-methyltransferase|nr:tRNA (cytidine(56)-2'-O)-methyltransferase [Candidatus Bathyarchaeota archaeon A05DMB-4]MDH7595696.1 tRNA (cytidine(56)-2'-O)-methyltransferase [Candidatus Bathyarchaeota archaeon]
MQKVAVLRWGHRAFRDERLTTHLVLAARAFGASEFFLADVEDEKIKTTIERAVQQWGGPFAFKMGIPWREIVKDWKAKDGTVIHLTMYGENIQTSDVLQRIKTTRKDVLVIVGSQKVPSEFYKISDFNVAIGNQPHSECSSLAVFLDRFFEGKGLEKEFKNWRIKLTPDPHGKHVIKRDV